MKKTLLLVFIHGFKGGDDTFGNFPAHLRAVLSHALPKIDVVAVTYPQFETRGDLKDCVARFREWLQNKVIDIEVANQTASPTVDPSVHVALIGHSMGGIIGADTLILLASEQPIPPPAHLSSSGLENDEKDAKENTFMFPHIQGLLAFDTPFVGIAPEVVSYAAESHRKTATAAYGALSEVANVFGWGSDKKKVDSEAGHESKEDEATPTARISAKDYDGPKTSSVDAAATPSWERWGRYAMFAGAAGAAAAGGAAALYTQRDRFSAGWNWASSHLEFVGSLARREDLRRRVSALSTLQRERGFGFANLYTCLGRGAVDVSSSASIRMNTSAGATSFGRPRPDIRTFCSLPEDVELNPNNDVENPSNANNFKRSDGVHESMKMGWIKSVNSKATDETKAHMSMFFPRENPEFYELAQTARDLLMEWMDNGWYESSCDRFPTDSSNTGDENRGGSDFMDPDDVVILS